MSMLDIEESNNLNIGSMATFPARFPIVQSMVETIAPQLDRLYIYVNETMEGFPDLSCFDNVTVLDGREYSGDISANGKMFPLRFVKNCRVFLLDDDIIYPADYVSRNLEVLDRFAGRCLVTTHGGVMPSRVDWYYERTVTWQFGKSLQSMQLCTLAGSGTLCFDQRHLPIEADEFLDLVWVDLKLSLMARENNLPIWVLPRNEGWLKSIQVPGLWEEFSKGGLTHHTFLSREYDFSFSEYSNIATNACDDAGVTPEDLGLDLELIAGLKTGRIPTSWLRYNQVIRKRKNYAHLLLKEMESA